MKVGMKCHHSNSRSITLVNRLKILTSISPEKNLKMKKTINTKNLPLTVLILGAKLDPIQFTSSRTLWKQVDYIILPIIF